MSEDPYTAAIKAAAAAITAPYREAETVVAFVEAFPMLAAARAINAALPYMRETLTIEAIPPGPCPATHTLSSWLPAPDGKPVRAYALCDLRAGHRGQHEATSDGYGHFRWSDNTPQADGDD